MGHDPQNVLDFWLEECGEDEWYAGGEAFDTRIRDRFEPAWQDAHDGALDHWRDGAESCLAFLILTDQFPRNMFRGTAQAFATDARAVVATKAAIARDFDLAVAEPQRQFFYLPLEHSEDMADQDRAVALIEARFSNPLTLLHARAHREVIARFGRFPYRNDALGRATTSEEAAFLAEGGYGAVVRVLEA